MARRPRCPAAVGRGDVIAVRCCPRLLVAAARRVACGPAMASRIPRLFLATARRGYSAYGYTQATALVYSQYGPPSEVLRYAPPSPRALPAVADHASLHSHSIPPAYGHEITVKFLVSPINPADINQIEGVYPSKPHLTLGLGTTEPSAVPGNEGVVEVVSTGANVKSFKPGDRAVMRYTSYGTWRTHASATETNLLRIPDEFSGVSLLSAATVSVNPCTAYRMLKDFTPLKVDDWFIQNGANSGVGRAAIQLGKLWGFKSINIVRDRPEIDMLKAELKELGADMVVTEEELNDKNFRVVVKELTGGNGVRLGLNCVGGKATTNMVKHIGSGGHVVTYGAMAKKPLTIPAGALIFSDVHFHGFWVSRWSDQHPEEKMAMLRDIFGYIQNGEFKDVPIEKTTWTSETKANTLVNAVERSGAGFGGKKQVFEFKD